MGCSLYTLKGLARGCKDSIGGIKKVWLAGDYDKVIKMVKVKEMNEATTSANAVFTLASSADASTFAAEFKPYNFFAKTGSMTSTLQVSDNAGSSWQTDVTLVFMKQETAKRLEIEAMTMGECAGVVADTNGKYWFIGLDNAITGSAASAETGTASGDLNGYNVTLHDESKRLPFEITDDDVISALEAITIV